MFSVVEMLEYNTVLEDSPLINTLKGEKMNKGALLVHKTLERILDLIMAHQQMKNHKELKVKL